MNKISVMVKKTIEFKPLVPPVAIERKYAKELRALVLAMTRDYASVAKIYKDKRHQIVQDDTWGITDLDKRLDALGEKWRVRFEEYAKENSPKVVNQVLKQSNLQIKDVLKDWFAEKRFMLLDSHIPVPMRQVMKASVEYNVSLIKSLHSQYAERVRGAVYRAVAGGGTLKDLKRDLVKYAGMEERRAKLVAGDQIRKCFNDVSLRRLASLGVNKVKWIHTHAGKTHRPYHLRNFNGDYSQYPKVNGLNGLIFDINNPPIIDEKTGERGYPSVLPFCHCRLGAVITFDE